jgi:hypothetical protein
MNDPEGLARAGEAGNARWRERFTWSFIAPRYEAILAGRECPGNQGLSCQETGLELVPRTRSSH